MVFICAVGNIGMEVENSARWRQVQVYKKKVSLYSVGGISVFFRTAADKTK